MTISTMTPAVQLGAPSTLLTGTSSAASAVTVNVPVPPAGAVERQTVITGITVSASGAASGPVTVTITDGSTAVFITDVSLAIGTPLAVPLPGSVAITPGNTAAVTVSAGASSCVIKANVAYMLV